MYRGLFVSRPEDYGILQRLGPDRCPPLDRLSPFDKLRVSGFPPLMVSLGNHERDTAGPPALKHPFLPEPPLLFLSQAQEVLQHLVGVLAQGGLGPLGAAWRAGESEGRVDQGDLA